MSHELGEPEGETSASQVFINEGNNLSLAPPTTTTSSHNDMSTTAINNNNNNSNSSSNSSSNSRDNVQPSSSTLSHQPQQQSLPLPLPLPLPQSHPQWRSPPRSTSANHANSDSDSDSEYDGDEQDRSNRHQPPIPVLMQAYKARAKQEIPNAFTSVDAGRNKSQVQHSEHRRSHRHQSRRHRSQHRPRQDVEQGDGESAVIEVVIPESNDAPCCFRYRQVLAGNRTGLGFTVLIISLFIVGLMLTIFFMRSPSCPQNCVLRDCFGKSSGTYYACSCANGLYCSQKESKIDAVAWVGIFLLALSILGASIQCCIALCCAPSLSSCPSVEHEEAPAPRQEADDRISTPPSVSSASDNEDNFDEHGQHCTTNSSSIGSNGGVISMVTLPPRAHPNEKAVSAASSA